MKLTFKPNFWMILSVGFFCLLSLGQLQRIEWQTLPAFYVHDVVLVIYVLRHLVRADFRKKCWEFVRGSTTGERVLLTWVGAGLAIAAFTGASLLYPLLSIARLTLYGLSLLSLTNDLDTKRLTASTLWYSQFLFIIFHITFGLMQYFLIPDTRVLFFLGWDDHYYRLISTMFDPGFAGILFTLSFLISCFWLSLPSTKKASNALKLSVYAIAALSTICTALTYSRASYVAFLASAIILIAFTWKKHLHIYFLSKLCLFLLIATIPFLPRPGGEGVKLERTSTINARISTIQQSFTTIQKTYHVIIGQGLFVQPSAEIFEYSGKPIHAKQPDNWLILLLTGTGFVGTVLALVVLIQKSKKLFNHNLFAFAGFIAILIHGLFNASITYPFVILVFGTFFVLTRTQDSKIS